MGKPESVSVRVEASPEAVFSVVTVVWRLPDWNRAITDVVEAPKGLVVGSVWKVRVHALGDAVRDERAHLLVVRRRHRIEPDPGGPGHLGRGPLAARRRGQRIPGLLVDPRPEGLTGAPQEPVVLGA